MGKTHSDRHVGSVLTQRSWLCEQFASIWAARAWYMRAVHPPSQWWWNLSKKKKIWMTAQGDFVYFKGDILCLFFLVHNFILSYYENRCSCLSAQKTHQFSHAVQCFCTLFPLRPFWAPVSLRTPAPEYPVCSGWSAHTCLSQLTTNSNRAIPWRHIFPCA